MPTSSYRRDVHLVPQRSTREAEAVKRSRLWIASPALDGKAKGYDVVPAAVSFCVDFDDTAAPHEAAWRRSN